MNQYVNLNNGESIKQDGALVNHGIDTLQPESHKKKRRLRRF